MDSALQLDNLRIVLVRSRNPLNIGAAARAMANFGISTLRVVHPFERAFREARSAVGAASVLECAEEFSSVADAVADCALVVGTTAVRERELQQSLHLLAEGAPLIRESLANSPVALLFGSEKTGLSKADLAFCHFLIHIPTRELQISMNLGQAVAVCLYEIARTRSTTLPSQSAHAADSELERMHSVLFDSLLESGYVKPKTEVDISGKVRLLIRRLSLNPDDADLLTGMFKKILYKLRHK